MEEDFTPVFGEKILIGQSDGKDVYFRRDFLVEVLESNKGLLGDMKEKNNAFAGFPEDVRKVFYVDVPNSITRIENILAKLEEISKNENAPKNPEIAKEIISIYGLINSITEGMDKLFEILGKKPAWKRRTEIEENLVSLGNGLSELGNFGNIVNEINTLQDELRGGKVPFKEIEEKYQNVVLKSIVVTLEANSLGKDEGVVDKIKDFLNKEEEE